MEFKRIHDRIGEYLVPHTDNFIFDELTDSCLEKAGVKDILKGVPVPMMKKGDARLTTLVIARNMAFIIGCDPNFRYRDEYIGYIGHMFTKEFARPLVNEGVEAAAGSDFDRACIFFRAAMLIDPENTDALYCYGRACKDSYERGDGEDYVGRYKAESLEAFEKLIQKEPDFDMGFYFLGFAYLNLGLYVKARLTWERFMEVSRDEVRKDEIGEWIEKLKEPVRIEQGYTNILSGRFEEGLAILEGYRDDERFNTWWPLWYYLGVGYKELDDREPAEKALLRVLRLSPSNIETMEELVDLYNRMGETDKAAKYKKKIAVVKRNIELDIAEKRKGTS